jgi:NTP pyrophosphohydrolases containing a Zn-finger, probably nucleic-acid-binding
MLPFTGSPLDRRSDKRNDPAWVAERLVGARILPLWQGQVLVTGSPVLKAAAVPLEVAQTLVTPLGVMVFLGLEEADFGEGRAVFAFDVSGSPDAAEVLKSFGEFRDLRTSSLVLRRKDLAILSQAKGMIEWHSRNGFCARCGAKTEIADAGTKRVCPLCGTEHFPRTDPAVIMLATYGERCLLARNVNWTPDFYSCLAGFMEPGESIEEAVRRELHEEAGIVVGAVRYFASQPWPFPAALMMGCYAEAEGDALKLDPTEIADAVWYTRDEARALLEGQIEARRGPMKAAIAWHLIDRWVRGDM